MIAERIEGALTKGEFERLMIPFEPFECRPVVAVGVSGGRDSTALALLAEGWAAARGGRTVALVVDHGLRPTSAGEAATTLRTLSGLGCDGTILRWAGAKPVAGIQAAARTARYGLLLGECRRRGILHLLIAHHADDQDETVAMRADRCSGPDGLAGMAAVAEHAEARVLRPLLPVPRSRLTATLTARGVSWFDDPSNADPRFERARLRAAGSLPPAAYHCAEARHDRERDSALDGVAILEIMPDGAVALDRMAFLALPHDRQARLVSRVVQAIGGRPHPPRRERLERALARLSAPAAQGKSGRSQDFTFSECQILLRRAPESGRLLWIVAAEHGRKDRQGQAQPLFPAAFFACGASLATHLKSTPSLLERNREPLQP